jgi:NAD(P)-dependent dehydrogenase (short-subunit alcohol dehydrogenase family)
MAAMAELASSPPGASAGVVVITGAAGALGSDVARYLVPRGYRTALIDSPRSAERLAAVAAELGAQAAAHAADVTAAAAWDEVLPQIERELGGGPTGAVLCAGGWQGGAPLAEAVDDTVYHAMVAANLDTAHGSLRALLPGMVKRRKGSVVVVGSRNVEQPWAGAGAAAYTATKSALVAMARAVAAEVLPYGVRVNAILPSTLDTPANRRAMPHVDPARWVSTASAAAVIQFLLSDDSRDVSGAGIPIYGAA